MLEFIDNPIPDWPDLSINSFSTFHYPDKIQENATPIIYRADPFQPGDGTTPEAIPMEKVHGLTTAALDAFFKEDEAPLELDLLEYYTLGENKMKNTILDLHQKVC